MKALCITAGNGIAEFTFEGEQPEAGTYYILENATSGTSAQNKAFHSLLNAFYMWMFRNNNFTFEDSGAVYNLSAPSAADFRELFKYRYGAGASHYQYVNDDMEIIKADHLEDIPDSVVDAFNAGNTKRIKAVLKSWSKYGIKQRKSTIDMLVMLIGLSGCNDTKVHEIMDGMNEG